MVVLIIYLIGVVITGAILFYSSLQTEDDITKKDIAIIVSVSALSVIGLVLAISAAISAWFDEHGDEIVIRKKIKKTMED